MKKKEVKKIDIKSLKVVDKKSLITVLGGSSSPDESLAPEKFSSLFSDIENDGGFSSLFSDNDV